MWLYCCLPCLLNTKDVLEDSEGSQKIRGFTRKCIAIKKEKTVIVLVIMIFIFVLAAGIIRISTSRTGSSMCYLYENWKSCQGYSSSERCLHRLAGASKSPFIACNSNHDDHQLADAAAAECGHFQTPAQVLRRGPCDGKPYVRSDTPVLRNVLSAVPVDNVTRCCHAEAVQPRVRWANDDPWSLDWYGSTLSRSAEEKPKR